MYRGITDKQRAADEDPRDTDKLCHDNNEKGDVSNGMVGDNKVSQLVIFYYFKLLHWLTICIVFDSI